VTSPQPLPVVAIVDPPRTGMHPSVCAALRACEVSMAADSHREHVKPTSHTHTQTHTHPHTHTHTHTHAHTERERDR
jgi:tRNA/tmRNA/rRNA uracil-C5-methylase (TrmA/RlmC/RlmD family)